MTADPVEHHISGERLDMKTSVRFFLAWMLTLSLLVGATWALVTQTTRDWFQKDVAMRAELAVNGARRALVSDLLRSDVDGLRALLSDITRDERILSSGFQQEGPTWAPNGRVLMFFRAAQGSGKPDLWSVDLTGANARKIPTPLDGSDPSWGPIRP